MHTPKEWNPSNSILETWAMYFLHLIDRWTKKLVVSQLHQFKLKGEVDILDKMTKLFEILVIAIVFSIATRRLLLSCEINFAFQLDEN